MTDKNKTNESASIRLHLTNVTGTGATQLLKSLLPALERKAHVADIYLPESGQLAEYVPDAQSGTASHYRRRLPNTLSRLLECIISIPRFEGDTPLLVLGDIPLRTKSPQIVFVQTPHLCRPTGSVWQRLRRAKYAISRWIFARNLRCVDAIIVQTPVMRDALIATYKQIGSKVHVVAQPVPEWLLARGPARKNHPSRRADKLRLIYPAASYPHKNHKLLSQIPSDVAKTLPIEELVLTIPEQLHPASFIPWISCVGLLDSAAMVLAYQRADALIFLSTDESYGFPLLEAMYMGIPIVCSDLPYAHALCGNEAIYFSPTNARSLQQALIELQERLATGWSPDWSTQLAKIPRDWDNVATSMMSIIRSSAADDVIGEDRSKIA